MVGAIGASPPICVDGNVIFVRLRKLWVIIGVNLNGKRVVDTPVTKPCTLASQGIITVFLDYKRKAVATT